MEKESNIVGGLDLSTVNALKNAATNWNDDWLNGKNIGEVWNVDRFKENSAVENVHGAINGITNSLQLVNDAVLTPKLTSYVLGTVQSAVMSYLQESIVEMLSFDGKAIVSYASALIPTHLVTGAEILKTLMQPKELLNELELEQTKLELFAKVNEFLGEQTTKIANYITEQLENINPAIANVCYYTQMGPVFVMDNINSITNKAIDGSIKGITVAKEFVNKEKEKQIQKLSDWLAEQAAEKINNGLMVNLKDKIDMLEKEKQNAVLQARSMVQQAKIAIFALLGI